MTPVELTTKTTILDGPDAIANVKSLAGLPGGRTLTLTNYTPDYVYSGHPVIRETATGDYKAWPLTGSAPNFTLAALPTGHTYEGTVEATVPRTNPSVGIMIMGVTNLKALRYQPGASALATMQANPFIKLIND